jgi:hypothetical protein
MQSEGSSPQQWLACWAFALLEVAPSTPDTQIVALMTYMKLYLIAHSLYCI